MAQSKGLTLVIGATGRQGGAVTRHLLRLGWPVRAMTRNPGKSSSQALKDLGVDVVQGDLADASSIRNALQGCYGVFSVQNPWEHGLDAEIAQGKRVVDQAVAANIQHIVFGSVSKCREPGSPAHYKTKGVVEQYIEKSGLPYTFIRPAFFMEMLDHSAGGEPRLVIDGLWVLNKRFLGGNGQLQLIAVDDLGRVAAEAFDQHWVGEAIELASDALSFDDMRKIYAASKRPQPRWVPVPPMWILALFNKDIEANWRFYKNGGWDIDIEATRTRFPWLQSFGQWASNA
jgi:uncharacterized protein YbjT (DUF2867 family)